MEFETSHHNNEASLLGSIVGLLIRDLILEPLLLLGLTFAEQKKHRFKKMHLIHRFKLPSGHR